MDKDTVKNIVTSVKGLLLELVQDNILTVSEAELLAPVLLRLALEREFIKLN